ncbi:hypothetical protein PACTADRAFT_4447 [Pachysolen tannophilus NRRL Y-2460]|uniref:SH3 domain-containing protein n=1 Tax=Pachysolen tannophilus NRRL Y-2460 TaxID=669874 RepID=A0A1E4TRZ4_PACTA|nr:hypothetical protein PACTADRAFT_4447 [Pachysolen tannophilus NRRL Y-2460]
MGYNYKDVDWVDIKKNVVRAPQILKNKAKVGTTTVDEEFELLSNRFYEIDEDINKLSKSVHKYHSAIISLLEFSSQLGHTMTILLDPTIERKTIDINQLNNGEHTSLKNYENATGASERISKYLESYTSIDHGINDCLNILLESFDSQIKQLTIFLKKVKKYIKERNYSLLDYDKYIDSIENLEDKYNSLTPKQQQQLFTNKRRIEDFKVKYDTLNLNLKKELPYFFALIREAAKPLFTKIYYTQFSIMYQMHISLSNNAPQEYLGNFKDFKKDVILEKQAKSSEILDSLKICNFHDEFLKTITNNLILSDTYPSSSKNYSASTTNLSRESSAKSSSKIFMNSLPHPPPPYTRNEPAMTEDYCIALYDFFKVQDGDLSFKENDKIKILQRNESNGWWKGELNGKIGFFPRNYVSLC